MTTPTKERRRNGQVAMLRQALEWHGMIHFLRTNRYEFTDAPKGLRLILGQRVQTARHLCQSVLLQVVAEEPGCAVRYVVSEQGKMALRRAEEPK